MIISSSYVILHGIIERTLMRRIIDPWMEIKQLLSVLLIDFEERVNRSRH